MTVERLVAENAALRATVHTLRDERDALREALEKYGTHRRRNTNEWDTQTVHDRECPVCAALAAKDETA